MPQRGKYEANDSPSVQYGERVLSWLYTPTGAPGMILWTHQCVAMLWSSPGIQLSSKGAPKTPLISLTGVVNQKGKNTQRETKKEISRHVVDSFGFT